jgi:hypothetical protein
MKGPFKDSPRNYVFVLTEKRPPSVEQFEEKIEKHTSRRFGSETFQIKYIHDVGQSIKKFNECLDHVYQHFGDLGETTFSIKNAEDHELGIKTVIISWKNPKRFNFLKANSQM